MADRKRRIIEGALRMSESGATDGERSSWLAKAQQLAEQYEMADVLSEWSPECIKSRSSIGIDCESIFVHRDEASWSDAVVAHLADAFHVRIIKRKVKSSESEYVNNDAESFSAYDLIGEESSVSTAFDLIAGAIDIGYDLVDTAVISEADMARFMTIFSRELIASVSNRAQIDEASSERSSNESDEDGALERLHSAMMVHDSKIDSYIQEHYNRTTRTAVDQINHQNSSPNDHLMKAESYIAVQKMTERRKKSTV